MGRGQIVSGGTDGQYQVKIIYAYRSRVEAKITQLQQDKTAVDARITALDALIAAEADQKKREAYILERSVLRLQSASMQKQVEYYQNRMPVDRTQTAWCVDLTEDLSGDVGTVEVPGEDALVLIRPGYNGRATYTAARDGQLMPAIAGSANQVLFNWMILPGWQRHKPTYRAGTIVPDSLDFDADTCSVCLDAAYSSQQSLPAIDGAGVTDCNMGDDPQAEYLTAAGEDFCSRNPGHPFCTQGVGAEILLTETMLAQLRQVNQAINNTYGRANDPSGIVAGDRWDVMVPGGSGDCEDFALTKMSQLVDNYGWSPDNLKLVTAYARNGEYHAMLGVRTTNRGLVVLDINYPEVMESARVPYRLDKIALASDTWANYSRRLDAVPIEYMQCNAAAFADGDRVIVEFTGQSWTSPKVVGFMTNPQACTLGIVVFPSPYDLTYQSGVAAFSEDSVGAISIKAALNDLATEAAAASSRLRAIKHGGYIMDGSGVSDAVRAFFPLTESLETRNDGENRWGHRGFSQNGKAFFVMGQSEWELYDGITSDCNAYDYGTDSWAGVAGVGDGGIYFAAFTIDGYSYLIDGEAISFLGIGEFIDQKQKYNGNTDAWSSFNDGGFNCARHSAFSVGGKGHMIGGYDDSNVGGDPVWLGYGHTCYRNDKFRQYAPTEDTWSLKDIGSAPIDAYLHGADGSGRYGWLLGVNGYPFIAFVDYYHVTLETWGFNYGEDMLMIRPAACLVNE